MDDENQCHLIRSCYGWVSNVLQMKRDDNSFLWFLVYCCWTCLRIAICPWCYWHQIYSTVALADCCRWKLVPTNKKNSSKLVGRPNTNTVCALPLFRRVGSRRRPDSFAMTTQCWCSWQRTIVVGRTLSGHSSKGSARVACTCLGRRRQKWPPAARRTPAQRPPRRIWPTSFRGYSSISVSESEERRRCCGGRPLAPRHCARSVPAAERGTHTRWPLNASDVE